MWLENDRGSLKSRSITLDNPDRIRWYLTQQRYLQYIRFTFQDSTCCWNEEKMKEVPGDSEVQQQPRWWMVVVTF
jgi:hypothetical protein